MKYLQKIAVAALGILTVLLPLKFTSLCMMPEATGYFPQELWEYIFVNFSSSSLGMASGTVFLLMLVSFARELQKKTLKLNYVMLGWIIVLGLSFIGFINASMGDYPRMATSHIAGFIAYAASVYIYINSREDAVENVYFWLMCGLMITLVVALHQHFWGFDEQLKFYYSEDGAAANVGNQDLSIKLNERRIFSTYGGSSLYAGYLLLAGGFGVFFMHKYGGLFKPENASRAILHAIFGVIILFVLVNTGSRAAIAAIAGAVVFSLFFLKIDRKYKIGVAVFIIVGGIGLILLSTLFGRNFGSFAERIGYWRTSFLMMRENWYAGSGWGDFFIDNMRFRIIDLDETARGPHNLFLIFGCSCGVFAMFGIMFVSLYGLWCSGVKFYRSRKMIDFILLFSLAAFLLHSMLDVNFQSSSSMAVFAALTIIAGENTTAVEMRNPLKYVFMLIMAVISVFAIVTSYNLTDAEKKFDIFKTRVHQSLKEGKFTPQEVLESFNEVEKCRPWSSFHHSDFAVYLMHIPYFRHEAEKYINIAVMRAPERPAVYMLKGRYEFERGNTKAALENISIARKIYPRSKKFREYEEKVKKSSKNL